MKDVALLGSTGSIGTQTLDVVRENRDKFNLKVIAAGSSTDLIRKQITEFKPAIVIMANKDSAQLLAQEFPNIDVYSGKNSLKEVAGSCDIIVNAIVGFAGLPVTLSALNQGKILALANKESLIAAGPVVQKARRTPGAEIIPVDSEHSALHQCLRGYQTSYDAPLSSVQKLILTASGGPFRGLSREELKSVTIEKALNHPTWDMGPKITIDSSTLMNKGLEVIEAHELFGVPFGQIEVIVHPQSIVHSMVEFADSSVIAQLSLPDMRLPIAYALNYPQRNEAKWGAINWSEISKLEFEKPDTESFPCLKLAYQAGEAGQTAPAWLSAANEVVVDAFLKKQIDWIDIPHLISLALDQYDDLPARDEDDIYAADLQARLVTKQIMESK
ncbi:MAG: 1-deoxy-D-xylulose-5-phosphate reductoisomerase [Acidimicrobiaceae bacterium TMED130]|nr:MAG: 1-deoxy-D-xylulose-5-phosphate reductoisomerase [Acidimicrobiaceae bacterium TMED130]